FPQALEARENQRHSMRAGGEALAVLLAAAGGAFALLKFRIGEVDRLSTTEAAAILLLGTLAGFLYFRGRVLSLRSVRDLAKQQERLAAVVEGTGVGYWEAMVGKDAIFVSDRWSQMVGLERDPAVPMRVEQWQSLVHPDDMAKVSQVIDASFNHSDYVFQLDYRLRHADGHWIWVLSRGTVIERAANGRPVRVVGTQLDITPRKVAEFALAESERKFRSLFERSPVGIVLSDFRTRRFLQVNDAFLEPSGFRREEILAMTFDQVARRGDGGPLNQPAGQRERELLRKDGSRYPAIISGIRMTDATGRDVVWSVVQDISHRKAVEQELAQAARRDRLTGLANRMLFMERLEESIERVRIGQQHMFAVLFLDFDRFKVVNDAMGHQAGDELLVQMADRLRKSLRNGDRGGEMR